MERKKKRREKEEEEEAKKEGCLLDWPEGTNDAALMACPSQPAWCLQPVAMAMPGEASLFSLHSQCEHPRIECAGTMAEEQ